ncbi:hypothetical protein RM697_08840 [Ichthyenterobacterium sp. W332]|uniref:Uncharacterized protein n=1 Tax=Microcosmobacter mediterraneus TaxID=3075607 RepID=A0ABU2YLN8_9FLAO|nr:hypothetical protein [Ichthyenterobacterium sp. W332]MDT0558752.1 hypothetical protein [Ichthyenterobacterium sp. W332]
MDRKLKLIWDFRGPVASKTAEHHCIHLKEFAQRENLPFHNINNETISELYSIAYITVDEVDMPVYRDALKPHRGQLAK